MLIIFLIMIYKSSVSRKYDAQNMSYDMVGIGHRRPILDNMSYDMVKNIYRQPKTWYSIRHTKYQWS